MENKQINETPKKDTQHRDWLFTINNPEQSEKELYDYLTALNHIKYFTFQREKGEQGTEHYQGYLCYTVPKLFSTVKNLFSEPNIRPAAHLEPRKGTKIQAREYCQKQDTRIGDNYEYGEFTAEGERADLKQLKQLIEQGADDLELADTVTTAYASHLSFVDRHRERMIHQKFGKIRRLNLEVTYIYGETGLGKTRYVMDKYGDENVYRITNYDGNLFDNYNNEDVIVFEEFRSQVRIDIMLNFLDVYPLRLPARYNNKIACFTKVYILTNLALDEQYKNVQREHPTTWKAFLRRIHKIYNFDKAVK
jgi:RNA helicase./Putative viral replication protein.